MDNKELTKKYMDVLQEAYKLGLGWDIEESHSLADGALCGLLTELGYVEIVKIWKSVRKWYK